MEPSRSEPAKGVYKTGGNRNETPPVISLHASTLAAQRLGFLSSHLGFLSSRVSPPSSFPPFPRCLCRGMWVGEREAWIPFLGEITLFCFWEEEAETRRVSRDVTQCGGKVVAGRSHVPSLARFFFSFSFCLDFFLFLSFFFFFYSPTSSFSGILF